MPVVVAINAFPTDTQAEYAAIREIALGAGARDAVVATNWAEGGRGAETLAAAVWEAASTGGGEFHFLYPDEMPLREKIETIATKVYGAALPALTVSYSGFLNGDTPAFRITQTSGTVHASRPSSSSVSIARFRMSVSSSGSNGLGR